jgi:hypothetical protein
LPILVIAAQPSEGLCIIDAIWKAPFTLAN